MNDEYDYDSDPYCQQELEERNTEIRREFAMADVVVFSANNFNDIGWPSGIYIGESYCASSYVPLDFFLPAVHITPQMLRPVFNLKLKLVKRNFPFGSSWWGLNSHTHKRDYVELPLQIEEYRDLGSLELSQENFLKFSRIIKKPIKVLKNDVYLIDVKKHKPLFIAYPSGKIKEL